MKDRGIYPPDHAAMLTPGKPYRPASGTEGAMFEAAYCDDCRHYDGCPIALNAWLFRIDEPEYPKQWQYGPDGQPTCTGFEGQ